MLTQQNKRIKLRWEGEVITESLHSNKLDTEPDEHRQTDIYVCIYTFDPN